MRSDSSGIARGHTHCRLITLPTRGPPETHQRALRGNVNSFPQNSASLLSALPASVDSVSDLLTVFFPPEQNLQPNRCPEFVVRRSRVRDAILWLQTHNPYYVDVTLDTEALASLPDHGIPHSLLHAARVLPEATVSVDPGPADAVPDDLLAPSLPTALHAAVLDVEGEATHPIARWQQALVATDAATESLTVSDPDPVLAASRVTSALDAARALGDLSASVNQPAPDSQSAYAVVPHGSCPLSAFNPAYWTLCFPHLFPYGENVDSSQRPVRLHDQLWIRSLLFRADRSPASFAWNVDHLLRLLLT